MDQEFGKRRIKILYFTQHLCSIKKFLDKGQITIEEIFLDMQRIWPRLTFDIFLNYLQPDIVILEDRTFYFINDIYDYPF